MEDKRSRPSVGLFNMACNGLDSFDPMFLNFCTFKMYSFKCSIWLLVYLIFTLVHVFSLTNSPCCFDTGWYYIHVSLHMFPIFQAKSIEMMGDSRLLHSTILLRLQLPWQNSSIGHLKNENRLRLHCSDQEWNINAIFRSFSHYCTDSGFKWHHQRKMTMLISKIFCLHFGTLGRS